jgi:uncharacterized protein YhbP (UPF0306 family)
MPRRSFRSRVTRKASTVGSRVAAIPAAAAVYLETEEIGQLRGAQLRGTLIRADGWTPTGAAGLRASYLARHPIAERQLASGHHHLYALIVTWAKLTDNRLGFGVHPITVFDGWCSEVEQSPA